MAKLPTFNGEVSKVSAFLIVCRLYIIMRIKNISVEEQILWVLSYVQGGSVDIWKEDRRPRKWKFEFCNSREVFDRLEKRIQRRKQWNNEDGRAEENRARKNMLENASGTQQ